MFKHDCMRLSLQRQADATRDIPDWNVVFINSNE